MCKLSRKSRNCFRRSKLEIESEIPFLSERTVLIRPSLNNRELVNRVYPRISMSSIESSIPRNIPSDLMIARRRNARLLRYLYVFLGFTVLSLVTVAGGAYAFWRDGYRLGDVNAFNDFVLCRTFEWMIGIWTFAMGASIASFLNVVAYRVPAGLPLIGDSFCPYCRVPISKRDNVPVVGWVFLAGRCRSCRLSISPRYPVFEAIGGLIALSVYLSTVLSHAANLPWDHVRSQHPYGIPMNLRFLDQAIFYVAALHALTLLMLFAAALTRWSHGVLPKKAWFVAAFFVALLYCWQPLLCVVPMETANSIKPISREPSATIATSVLAASVGGFIGYLIAWISIPLMYRSAHVDEHSMNEDKADGGEFSVPADRFQDQWRWAWLFIGTVMLWKATLVLFVLVMVLFFVIRSIARPYRWRDAFRDPIAVAWIGMLFFLPFWRSMVGLIPF